MHSNFRSHCYFLARHIKFNVFWQNFTMLENCWTSEAVHGLASCCIIRGQGAEDRQLPDPDKYLVVKLSHLFPKSKKIFEQKLFFRQKAL